MEYLWTDVVKGVISSMHLKKDMDLRRSSAYGYEDIKTANGLPCAFEQYEIYQENGWKTISNGIPTDKDKIRFQQ